MTRTRRLTAELATGLLLVAGTALLGFGGGAAWAEAPAQAGWWSQTNPGSVGGTSAAPAPPDVPAGGLLVEGGMSSAPGSADAGPTAFGAVVYRIPAGQSPGPLTLDVAPGSATTPSVTLELCPLSSAAINAEQGGSMADAPGFSCTADVTAQPSAAGDRYTFNVSKLVADDTLAVAVLPTGPTDRVVLASPGDPSLPLRSVAGSTGAAAPAGSASGGAAAAGPAPGPADTSASGPGGGDLPADPTSASSAPSAAPALAGSGSQAVAAGPQTSAQTSQAAGSSSSAAGSSGPGAAFPVPASDSGPDNAKPLAVVLVLVGFLIGGGIWLAAGRAAARADLRNHPEGAS